MTAETLDDSWWQQAGDRPRRVWQDAGGAVAHHDQCACALPRQVGHDQHDQHDDHDEEDENDNGGEGVHQLMYQMLAYLNVPIPNSTPSRHQHDSDYSTPVYHWNWKKIDLYKKQWPVICRKRSSWFMNNLFRLETMRYYPHTMNSAR